MQLYFCFILLASIQLTFSRTITSKIAPNDLKFLESTISNNSCEFYNDMENFIPCGSQGYVQKFIYKYCLAYLKEKDKFINQDWQNGVRVCLQKKMLLFLESDPTASCEEIKNYGFHSHTDCYIRPDPNNPELTFCHLPLEDILEVMWIAKGAILEPAVWSQLLVLFKQCTSRALQ